MSAVENPDGTVTLPLHRGTSRGRTVWYILLDSSNGDDASAKGINTSQKLANAPRLGGGPEGRGGERRRRLPGLGELLGRSADRRAGSTGLLSSAAQTSAVGEDGYGPLIELPGGTIENAPQVANDTGHAPKVVAIDFTNLRVTLEETAGFQGGKPVLYLSTDSSHPVAAALENVTWRLHSMRHRLSTTTARTLRARASRPS